jgi:hypothetical protein
VAAKLLEVQRDKHESLRTGYTGLYSATSVFWFFLVFLWGVFCFFVWLGNPFTLTNPVASVTRLKDMTLLEERVRQLVNAFPTVVSRGEDGTFVLAPHTGPAIDAPLWWQVCVWECVGVVQFAHIFCLLGQGRAVSCGADRDAGQPRAGPQGR